MEKISTSKNWKKRLEEIAIQVSKSNGLDAVELTDGVVRKLEEDESILYNLERQQFVKTILDKIVKGNYILIIAHDEETAKNFHLLGGWNTTPWNIKK